MSSKNSSTMKGLIKVLNSDVPSPKGIYWEVTKGESKSSCLIFSNNLGQNTKALLSKYLPLQSFDKENGKYVMKE